MSEHTPGPWEVRRANRPVDGAYDWAIGAEIDDAPYCIAEAVGRAAEDVWLPAEANARLIAQAWTIPALREALVMASAHVPEMVFDKIRAALKLGQENG